MTPEALKNLQLAGGQNSILAMAIKELKETLENRIEYNELIAQQRHAYFQSLLKSGFNEQQAMELVKVL